MTRFLALDLGEARIGVALSDASGFLASPYTTLHVSRDEEQTLAAIQTPDRLRLRPRLWLLVCL